MNQSKTLSLDVRWTSQKDKIGSEKKGETSTMTTTRTRTKKKPNAKEADENGL